MNLEQAIRIAASIHAGQKDKQGQPYILHPLRVMLTLNTEEERILAVLHDTIEDSSWVTFRATAEMVTGSAQPLPAALFDALNAITRRKDEQYATYIERLGENRLARVVKLTDLHDNMLPERMLPTAEGASLRQRYAEAQARLLTIAWLDYAMRKD